eukprot:m.208171 g.208171  ORF g.208171 m.208171 type:complete len:304 (+) comp10129_c0_seq1:163-1074(+)
MSALRCAVLRRVGEADRLSPLIGWLRSVLRSSIPSRGILCAGISSRGRYWLLAGRQGWHGPLGNQLGRSQLRSNGRCGLSWLCACGRHRGAAALGLGWRPGWWYATARGLRGWGRRCCSGDRSSGLWGGLGRLRRGGHDDVAGRDQALAVFAADKREWPALLQDNEARTLRNCQLVLVAGREIVEHSCGGGLGGRARGRRSIGWIGGRSGVGGVWQGGLDQIVVDGLDILAGEGPLHPTDAALPPGRVRGACRQHNDVTLLEADGSVLWIASIIVENLSATHSCYNRSIRCCWPDDSDGHRAA